LKGIGGVPGSNSGDRSTSSGVIEYHSAVRSHGMLIGELEARMPRGRAPESADLNGQNAFSVSTVFLSCHQTQKDTG
jgi:hypothetical protein